jgi:hypothetical protein
MRRLPVILLAALRVGSALAGDQPVLGTQTLLELPGLVTVRPGSKPSQDMYLKLRQDAALELSEQVAMVTLLRLEPVTTPRRGEARAFKGEGLFADEVFAQWNLRDVTVRAGKFSPNFGRAWYLAPGMFGDLFVSDYQIVDQVGAEVSYGVTTADRGRHTISVSDTMADRTFLSQSWFTNRGQTHLSGGGPSNTRGPESYALAYDGAAVPALGGMLGYQVAYASLGRGIADRGQERLAAVSVNMALPVAGGEVRPVFEAVRRWDTNGVRGLMTDYLTGGVEVQRGRWTGNAVATARTTRGAGRDEHDRMAQGTIGYDLGGNWSLATAYLYQRAARLESHTIALQVSFRFTRCDGCRVLEMRH